MFGQRYQVYLKKVFLFLFVLSIAFVGIMGVAGYLLSKPAPSYVGPPPADLSAQSVTIASPSGSVLHGWFSRAPDDQGAVLLLHGIRGSRLSMVERARFLRAAGYSVLLFDFQAHGESAGSRITFGRLEGLDAEAALAFLRHQLPGQPIAAIGASMGGAAALLGARPLDVDALILEAVYPTIDAAIANRMRMQVGILEPLVTPLLKLQLQPVLGVSSAQLRPIDRISQIEAPVFILAGTADNRTTIQETRQLFSRAPQPKQFWQLKHAGHVDLYKFAPAQYRQRILSFLEHHLRYSRASGNPATTNTPRSEQNLDVVPLRGNDEL